jgi:DNA mismatch repair protein MutL
VRCDGGSDSDPAPCGCPAGTTIEIRDLFYNVPARRRFLKSAGAERARIQEVVAELSLARLDIGFTLVADGKEVLVLPANGSLSERFARCFGAQLAGGLLPVQRQFENMSVQGLIAEPDLARRDSKLELCFVNGRLAREKSAFFAIRQAYREYLMGGRFPVYVLDVTLPPDQVDVNVHPRKAEVRFVDARAVAGRLHETVRSALQDRGLAQQGAGGVLIDSDMPRARSGFPELPAGLCGDAMAPAPAMTSPYRQQPSLPIIVREGRTPPRDADQRPNPFEHGPRRFLQVMDLYLLLEAPDGLLVVDQHALHERVVYERLRREHAAAAVRIQRLVVPTIVDVTPSELAWLEEAREALAASGLLVDQIGPGSIGVHGVPAVLSRVAPEKLVRSLLEGEPGEGRAKIDEQIAERFHSMACRAAVMSGDKLEAAEIEALLREAATLEHPHNCPHGRPTVLTFTGPELERYFRRRC